MKIDALFNGADIHAEPQNHAAICAWPDAERCSFARGHMRRNHIQRWDERKRGAASGALKPRKSCTASGRGICGEARQRWINGRNTEPCCNVRVVQCGTARLNARAYAAELYAAPGRKRETWDGKRRAKVQEKLHRLRRKRHAKAGQMGKTQNHVAICA